VLPTPQHPHACEPNFAAAAGVMTSAVLTATATGITPHPPPPHTHTPVLLLLPAAPPPPTQPHARTPDLC
jgi:hypothetical protein